MVARHDDTLMKHLTSRAMRNAAYLSPDIQNELIHVIGKEIIQSEIVEEIKNAKFFSIMADKATTHNKEQCALCVRFVDREGNIREEFLKFLPLIRTTGEHIAGAILKAMENLGLNISNVRGQGYDRCSAMASDAVGAQAIIKRNSPKALWIHCSGHCLNLVIVNNCKLTAIRNMLDKLTETCLFFRDSSKRTSLLEQIVSKSVMQTYKRKAILDLCKTRWAMRHTACSHFCTSYVFIVKALDVIAHDLHREEVSELFQDGWDPSSRARASAILNAICSFNFIITFLVVYKMLSHLSGITVKLQGSTTDIRQAFSEIESVKDNYKSPRTNINEQFHRIYEHAVFVAAKVNVEPERLRIAGRQAHRNNAPTTENENQIKSYFL